MLSVKRRRRRHSGSWNRLAVGCILQTATNDDATSLKVCAQITEQMNIWWKWFDRSLALLC